jgi:hypothetical protein
MARQTSICFAAAHGTRVLWLAVLLAIFAALAPTLSHALAAAGQTPAPLLEVCTSSGMRPAGATGQGGEQSEAPTSLQTLSDCSFCWLATDRLVPAPYSEPYAFLGAVAHQLPRAEQPHFFLRPWVLAPPPRGPPFFS